MIVQMVHVLFWLTIITIIVIKPSPPKRRKKRHKKIHINKPCTIFEQEKIIGTYPESWHMLSHVRIFPGKIHGKGHTALCGIRSMRD